VFIHSCLHLRRYAILPILTILFSFIPYQNTLGQTGTHLSQPVDIVLVVDDSGSMTTCHPWRGSSIETSDCISKGYEREPSDPKNLRYSAIHLLLSLLEENDRIAVVRFDTKAEDVGNGRLEKIGSDRNRQSLIESIRPPTDFSNRGFTRIDLGLERGASILLTRTDITRPGYIILLTDGDPTQPDGQPSQEGAVRSAAKTLRENGIDVIPVILCNTTCPGEFIRDTIGIPREARTSQDLLRIYSDVLGDVKPGFTIISHRDANGNIVFFSRPSHGLSQVVIVTEKSDPVLISNSQGTIESQLLFEDNNVVVRSITGSRFPEGKWTISTSSDASFSIVRTETYPDLIHPPSVVPGSSIRYVPSGKPILIVATVIGPGGGEPSFLILPDGTTTKLRQLSTTNQITILPNATSFIIQVGEDVRPLQIRRRFSIQTLPDLPTAVANIPVCTSNTPCELKVAFPSGAEVSDLTATVFVTDATDETKLFYQNQMNCVDAERTCTDTGFIPEDGRTYIVRFTIAARSKGILFSDWAETVLAMRPAVYVRGLPDPIDLKNQPENGWPVTVISATNADLGRLKAVLSLYRDGEAVPEGVVNPRFSVDLRGRGEQQGRLHVDGIEQLPDGRYTGQLSFVFERQPPPDLITPSPMQVDFRIAPDAVRVREAFIKFPSVRFDPSPNAVINRTYYLPIDYSNRPFRIEADIIDNSCQDLRLILYVDEPQMLGDGSYRLPLNIISSSPPAQPITCDGTIQLRTLAGELIEPQTIIRWQLAIRAIEWKILGTYQSNELNHPLRNSIDLGRVYDQASIELAVRYSGDTPFKLIISNISVSSTDRQHIIDSSNDVTLDISLSGDPLDQPDVYRVPIQITFHNLPTDWFADIAFNGTIQFGIDGLPGTNSEPVPIRFSSPSRVDRYVFQPVQQFVHFIFSSWLGCLVIPVILAIFFLILHKLYDRTVTKSRASERSSHRKKY